MCVTTCRYVSHVEIDDPGAWGIERKDAERQVCEKHVWSIWKSRTHVRGTHFSLLYLTRCVWCVLQCFSDIYIWTGCRSCACDGSVCMVCACVCVFRRRLRHWLVPKSGNYCVLQCCDIVCVCVCVCVGVCVCVRFLGGVGSTGLWLALACVLSLLQVLLVSAGLGQTLQLPLLQILQVPPQLDSLLLFLQLPMERKQGWGGVSNEA